MSFTSSPLPLDEIGGISLETLYRLRSFYKVGTAVCFLLLTNALLESSIAWADDEVVMYTF